MVVVVCIYLEVNDTDSEEEASVGQFYAPELQVLDEVEAVASEVARGRLRGWDALCQAGLVASVHSWGVHAHSHDLACALHQELRRL